MRVNPSKGVEVVGLSEWPVSSFEEINKAMVAANERRSVASTEMNATSSRAHTVVIISYSQKELHARGRGKHTVKSAKMNLVDLAGSERQAKSGAAGDRLKEGAMINLSLTTLGKVITALAEACTNPRASIARAIVIPYRDSKLTTILQDALGGNSKTVMICALSPADSNYDETLSTLRYADRAKMIKNRVTVNQEAKQDFVEELKMETQKLKAALMKEQALLKEVTEEKPKKIKEKDKGRLKLPAIKGAMTPQRMDSSAGMRKGKKKKQVGQSVEEIHASAATSIQALFRGYKTRNLEVEICPEGKPTLVSYDYSKIFDYDKMAIPGHLILRSSTTSEAALTALRQSFQASPR